MEGSAAQGWQRSTSHLPTHRPHYGGWHADSKCRHLSDLHDMQEFLAVLIEVFNPIMNEYYYRDTIAFNRMWDQANAASREQKEEDYE